MSDIDDKILAAMNADERAQVEPYTKEPGIFGLVATSFSGSMRVVVMFVFLLILIFVGLLIYSAFQFFPAQDVVTKLDWLAIGLTALIIIGLLRLWYFLELVRLSLIREIKRLELQISLLSKKLG